MLLEGYLSREQREYVQNINECVNSIRGLITNLLDFSVIESGKLKLKVQKRKTENGEGFTR